MKSEKRASIILDTVEIDGDMKLAERGITFKIVNESGPGGGFPEVKFMGTEKALVELVRDFWGDSDLLEYLEVENG